jgi:hypothetical protein
VAFWEELSAVNFYGPSNQPNFAGFSAQTFDSLFAEMAQVLPDSILRDLMRYHWRMKYMDEMKPISMASSGGVNPQFWTEAQELRNRLLQRLDHYGKRSSFSVFLRSAETCSRDLLTI